SERRIDAKRSDAELVAHLMQDGAAYLQQSGSQVLDPLTGRLRAVTQEDAPALCIGNVRHFMVDRWHRFVRRRGVPRPVYRARDRMISHLRKNKTSRCPGSRPGRQSITGRTW